MVSVLLTAQLQRVKDVLATWKKVDERVSQLCSTLLAAKGLLPGTACSADKVTAGLVGFLSGNFSDNTWRDEYLGVNATVHNNNDEANTKATVTTDGVTFHGAWAEWPVGQQGQNQLYHFANSNFTLVATVSIHEVPKEEGPIPLMGVRMNDAETPVLLGLSYNKGKKWQVLCGGGTTQQPSGTWGPEKAQHVVVLLKNGNKGSVYVDGQRVGDAQCQLNVTDSKEVSHFYIGGDGRSEDITERQGVPVTVTNVLLYNRPLDGTEIGAFNPNKASIPSSVKTPIGGNVLQSSGGRQGVPRQTLGSSGADGKTAGGKDGQEEQQIHPRVGDANATVLSSSLGNVPQGNDGDAGTVRGSGLLSSLLLLLLGLWGFAAL
ncbi:trans-sialidase, putative [Trypanosoma cruzi marinkellei]|uniref:Trans-sialidase, putative n=1 Tax=Trypanosoma cruzi marinkellei TaxID=85056 RepID=K2MQI6_TRYCR|nr:trans-sialidase, putative [Trypanosoma cruzi marinkellei]